MECSLNVLSENRREINRSGGVRAADIAPVVARAEAGEELVADGSGMLGDLVDRDVGAKELDPIAAAGAGDLTDMMRHARTHLSEKRTHKTLIVIDQLEQWIHN